MDKLKDKILQYIISGKYAEDQVVDADITSDPAFDSHEFETLKEIWDLSDGLKDYKTATKSDAWQNIVQETGINEAKRTTLTRRWSVAAAIVALIAAGLYFLTRDPYVTTEVSQDQVVTLPDNSTVSLVAGSSIRHLKPGRFIESPRREIFLTGQGTFDVQHDPSRPFVVATEHTSVDVTGTRFIYLEEGIRSEAENIEGQIRFGTNDGQQSVILNQGDKASFDGGQIELVRFEPPPPPPPPPPPGNNLEVRDLVDILGAIYDRQLVFSPSVRPNRAVVKVNLNLTLGELLQALENNPNVEIEYSSTGGGNYVVTRLRGIDSGLQANYGFEPFERGVPFDAGN